MRDVFAVGDDGLGSTGIPVLCRKLPGAWRCGCEETFAALG